MRRLVAALLGAAVVTSAGAQLVDRPRIGVKIGLAFSDTYNAAGTSKNLDAWWTIGADVALSGGGFFGGASRVDADLAYGPGDSSQFRAGLSQVWKMDPGLEVTPYGGVGVGFLFEDKRAESDRTVLSGKLFGGVEFGHNLFAEVAILQSSRLDAVLFGFGMRF